MKSSIISAEAKIGNNVTIGEFCIIEKNVEIGDDVTIENYTYLHANVKIGKGTLIRSYVELRPHTVIGENCYIDSRVSTSGDCIIGNKVTLRYDSIIARGCVIGDNTYVCPRVMTNNLDTGKEQIGGAKIGANCFIGTNAVLHHGLNIEDKVIIGTMSFVNKDCEQNKVYIGTPAKEFKR